MVTRRQGPFPDRITDAGSIMDLATHDIDLTAWVTERLTDPCRLGSRIRSGRAARGPGERGRAELSGGIVVTHLVNWLSPFKERVTTVTGELGCFMADTLTADLTFYKNGPQSAQWDQVAAFRGSPRVTSPAMPSPSRSRC